MPKASSKAEVEAYIAAGERLWPLVGMAPFSADSSQHRRPKQSAFWQKADCSIVHQFFSKDFYPISFFYLGMLTKVDRFHLGLPNLTLQQIFVQYFNELNHF